jgi:hypothetical protein
MGMDADADMGTGHELSIIGFGISDQIFPELSWLDRRMRKTPGIIRHRIQKSNNRISAIKKTLGCQAQFFLYIKKQFSCEKNVLLFCCYDQGVDVPVAGEKRPRPGTRLRPKAKAGGKQQTEKEEEEEQLQPVESQMTVEPEILPEMVRKATALWVPRVHFLPNF